MKSKIAKHFCADLNYTRANFFCVFFIRKIEISSKNLVITLSTPIYLPSAKDTNNTLEFKGLSLRYWISSYFRWPCCMPPSCSSRPRSRFALPESAQDLRRGGGYWRRTPGPRRRPTARRRSRQSWGRRSSRSRRVHRSYWPSSKLDHFGQSKLPFLLVQPASFHWGDEYDLSSANLNLFILFFSTVTSIRDRGSRTNTASSVLLVFSANDPSMWRLSLASR